MGSVRTKLGRERDPLPGFVSMQPKLENDVPNFAEQSHGQFAGWLGPTWDPLTIDADPSRADYRVGEIEPLPEVPEGRMHRSRSLLDSLEDTAFRLQQLDSMRTMQRNYSRAFDLLASAVGRSAFDLTQEPAAVRDAYGRNPHGQSVLQARRLVERGVPLVTVYWPNDGIRHISVQAACCFETHGCGTGSQ